jgi:2-hydroxymuconate-semialdehyde hydrolase
MTGAGAAQPPGVLADRGISHDGFSTNFLQNGSGPAVLLVHGSGPGVSARANWHGTMTGPLAGRFTMIAPDVAGFGGTRTPPGMPLDHASRVGHLLAFLDALEIGRVDVIGNSMGGALALAVAARRPDRVRRLVLMGSAGIGFPLTPGLDAVWGYQPSVAGMRALMRLFAYDQALVGDELVQLRYQASAAPGVQERYAEAFAPPRQRHVDAMALTPDQLRAITAPTLLVHGSEDRVVPLEMTSLRLVRLLPDCDLKVYGRCGHWTQIERAADFQRDVGEFLSRPDPG